MGASGGGDNGNRREWWQIGAAACLCDNCHRSAAQTWYTLRFLHHSLHPQGWLARLVCCTDYLSAISPSILLPFVVQTHLSATVKSHPFTHH